MSRDTQENSLCLRDAINDACEYSTWAHLCCLTELSVRILAQNMSELHLQQNLLLGQLPASWAAWGRWPSLFWLDLWSNSLTGAVPATWANWNAFPALEVL